ncbi:MAG TPA: FliA/WhiG family RNA polymerase sigma factor [Gaiellales bacterium]|jgi:RNA polymerase sigma factor for flagellar operon FliA|nr:FliA/WhiG family RNA polymerase sigma factor [Gaiellales bacterium]
MKDSSEFQRLTAAEAEALWRAWSVRKDSSARDRLVLAYSPMIRYIASRKVREFPSHSDFDDFLSCGMIALIEAVDRFDPAKGASFEQFAWTRVAGAMVDELRRQDWASRSARRMSQKLEHAADELYARTGSAPSHEELAAVLELTVPEVWAILENIERADVISLNAPTRSSDPSMPLEIGDTVEARDGRLEPERSALASERLKIMLEAIAGLSEREQRVLHLVHSQEMQGADVGRLLGVSESRVSQILAEVRNNLREQMSNYDAAAA